MGGELIYEFVGLRPKLYSILGHTQRKQAAKGIQRAVAKKITHENYKHSLFQKSIKSVKTCRISNEKHSVHTVQVEKNALSPYDDKRFIS